MKKNFDIVGMGCAACQARIQNGLSQMEGVISCEVNLLTNSMNIEFNETKINVEEIIKKVEDLGYKASLHEEKNEEANEAKARTNYEILKRRLIISISLAAPLFLISMIMPIKMLFDERVLLGIQILLSIALVIINFKFYKSGIKALFKLAPNMDSLIAVGTIASFIARYFDSVGMILTLVTFGKFLEEKAKGKTTDALNGLMSLAPDTATVLRDGNQLIVKTSVIKKGDILVCHPGESIAVDGEVIDGKSHINNSMMTGESRPLEVSSGDKVIAGTINVEGYFVYRCTEIGGETVLSKIIKLAEEAGNSKAPIARIADRVSLYFVPSVIGISLITFVIWVLSYTLAGSEIDWTFAAEFAISVLVVSCPCALGFATPVAIMVATGRGAKEGIIIKSAEAFENLGKVNTIIFDKTGTITKGIVSDDLSLKERLDGDKRILNSEEDVIRPEAKDVISGLKKKGIRTILLSGDKKEVVEAVSKEVGVDEFYFGVLPDEKDAVITKEKGNGRIVSMVGDGVNDAIAIKKADIGIAIGTGTDIAIDAADIVIMNDSLEDVEKAISLSQITIKVIKEGLFWAFLYNIILIPISAGALYPIWGISLSPVIAAACMSISSATVITNALRLRKKKI